MNPIATPAVALLIAILGSTPLSAQTKIWGDNGSTWSPSSPLPDFSHAGYHQGEKPLPSSAGDVSVTDFGAVGDGKTDCTEAFLKAIAASPGKTISIPQGVYLLSDRLHLNEPGTVLIGEGMDKTILFFQRGLQEIEPTVAYTGGGTGVKTNQWSWSGGIISIGSTSSPIGARVAITKSAKRGANQLTVKDPSNFKVGEACAITMQDDSDFSLIHYLYRGDPGDISRMKKHTVSQPVVISKIEGNTITINQPLSFEIRPEWSPSLGKIVHPSQEIGISDFTIRFPEREYRGHWQEDGMNGFVMRGVNNWARNIRIQNCDSGLFLSGIWCTAEGLVVEGTRKPHKSGSTGHHGIVLTGKSCLLKDFKIDTKFFHDVTVSGGSLGNVFSQGSAVNLSIDHHRRAPYENLFTQINVGEGTRVWVSGGTKGLGRHAAAGATFWNIDSNHPFPLPTKEFSTQDLILVGLNTNKVEQSDLLEGWHYEEIRPDQLQPANLYEAQLARRLGKQAKSKQ